MLSRAHLLPVVRLAATAILVFLALLATDLLQRGVNQPTFLLLVPIIILATAAWGAVNGVTAAALSAASPGSELRVR